MASGYRAANSACRSSLDYEALVDEATLVVDLRNATGARGSAAEHVFKL